MPHAALTSLELSGISLPGGYSADTHHYEVRLESADSVSPTTVSTATVSGAEVAILPGDADPGTDGHQVELSAGPNTIGVMVLYENQVDTYTVAVFVAGTALSDTATLSAVSFSGAQPFEFDGSDLDNAEYVLALPAWQEYTTVSASAADASAELRYHPRDADVTTEGHQVRLDRWLATTARVEVVSGDGSTRNEYVFRLGRDTGSVGVYGDLHPDNDSPRGIWSDGEVMWVMDTKDVRVYAYDLETMARLPDRDISDLSRVRTGDSAVPRRPAGGLASDGEVMWVAERLVESGLNRSPRQPSAARVSAYRLDTGEYAGSEFCLGKLGNYGYHYQNEEATGLWVHDGILWSADPEVAWNTSHEASLWAYDISTASCSTDVRAIGDYTSRIHLERALLDTLYLEGNTDPAGVWSPDGRHMWIVDPADDHIYVYDNTAESYPYAGISRPSLDTRLEHLEIDASLMHAVGNDDPWGIWSDGWRLFVSDTVDRRVYVYEMPTAALESLELTGMDIGEFDSLEPVYDLVAPAVTASTTITAAAHMVEADVTIVPEDADPADGHQVELAEGANEITVTVANGGIERTYTINVTRLAESSAQQEEELEQSEPDESESGSEQRSDEQRSDEQRSESESDVSESGSVGPALTASFEGVPDAHSGAGSDLVVRVRFSEPLAVSYVTMRDGGGVFVQSPHRVVRAKRVEGRSDLWDITVRVGGDRRLSVTVFEGSGCDGEHAVCTADGRPVSRSAQVFVEGPSG